MNDTPPFAALASGEAMRSVIGRIATGPTQSKDISREEARVAMEHVLTGRAEPVQAAIFLIALRMKRETDDEFRGIVDALGAALEPGRGPLQVDTEALLDIADPFDGFDRCLPAAPFLAPLLAACGLPSITRGLARVGPKFGITHRQVLAAAGAPVDDDTRTAADRLADPGAGWAYLDQCAYSPALHALVALRTEMVKRPAITTAERVVGPLRARGRTHLALGYVHKAYPRIYALLARHAGYDSTLLVRGVEGGIVPSLRQSARLWRVHGDLPDDAESVDPGALGIESTVRAPGAEGDVAPDADGAAEAGVAALDGAPGATRDALVLGAALALWHAGVATDARAGADRARAALDDGSAAARFAAAAA